MYRERQVPSAGRQTGLLVATLTGVTSLAATARTAVTARRRVNPMIIAARRPSARTGTRMMMSLVVTGRPKSRLVSRTGPH